MAFHSRLTFLVAATLLLPITVSAFVVPVYCSRRNFSVLHMAKKKGKRSQAGKGFSRGPEKAPKQVATETAAPRSESMPTPLQSIESGGSDAIPAMATDPSQTEKQDSELPAEERAKKILREQYGLKTLEEQQTDAKKAEKMAEQRKKREEWEKMSEKEDFDIMAMLPAPVLVGIDRFLKAGVAVCTILFVGAGIAITVEAWSAATKNPLPEDVSTFIVNVVEPNFTPGLLVLLGFSVSLGVFAALQLGSESSQYREDR